MITIVLAILAVLWLIGARFWDMLLVFLTFLLCMAVIWGGWLVFLYFFSVKPILGWLGL
tara:strand:+ start:844 stop:1020 length:177 start_codon:yes stop_codon:yes gene_type:complete